VVEMEVKMKAEAIIEGVTVMKVVVMMKVEKKTMGREVMTDYYFKKSKYAIFSIRKE
jgi:hypothetical protein